VASHSSSFPPLSLFGSRDGSQREMRVFSPTHRGLLDAAARGWYATWCERAYCPWSDHAMIDPDSLERLSAELRERMADDKKLLDELRNEVRPLRAATRRIQPRSATAISLVGTDGGNNRIEFDPFMAQLVRVVDSSANEYCLEVVTPTTNTEDLSRKQFDASGDPVTALGELMAYLGVGHLWNLTPMIQRPSGEPAKPSWVQVYREIVEWAILFKLVRTKDFGTDTLIVVDGFLRSKVFKGDLFARLRQGLEEAIQRQERESRRRIFLAGIAKHSKVLQRYRLAMVLEGIMDHDYSCYVEIPRQLEEKAYVWSEYARGDEREQEGGEANKFVAGKMFFVKFGSRRRDPIWAIDLFQPQASKAQEVLGYLLADSVDGFPVPFYPRCLQRAHENAALVDFDMDILQQGIFSAIRNSLANDAPILDTFRLAGGDPSSRRYS